jgi:transcriptional repressor NrdR
VEEGAAIRRRRECTTCGHRVTTFERVEEQVLFVRKRSGQRVPFDTTKIATGVAAACKGRGVADDAIRAVATEVEELARAGTADLSTEEVGRAVLERLRQLDQVAYLRFASVYKGFADAADFARELRLLEDADAAAR